ncbi:MAG: hypothetical protein GX756_02290 [Clostridiales bacterium]|nr:hypothetical protein [Clostridiales bacterium]
MRSTELKDEDFKFSKFRRSFNDQTDYDIFVPGINRGYSYINARKYDGENYMSKDFLKEGVTRVRPFISREDTAIEREKRIAAHSTLYEDRYNQARRIEQEQESEKERRRISLRDLDDRPQRTRFEPEAHLDDASEPMQEAVIPIKEREFSKPQYKDYYSEYDSSPYTYNRNRIDNDAYQSTFFTQNAPSYRPTSNVYGLATTIAERYKKRFAERENDLKPSAKTMQYAQKKPDEKIKGFKLIKKGAERAATLEARKGLITLYVTIVVVIAVLIATTAMMISTLSQDISALENELAERQNYIAQTNAELSKYDDDNYIYAKAKEQGMQDNDDIYTVELIPVKYQPEPTGGANWFDALCDFLSGVFGSG